MQPQLKISKDGSKRLICYYEGRAWDEAVWEAEKQFGILGENHSVIVLPLNMKRDILNPK